jgi:ribose transport system permease protein
MAARSDDVVKGKKTIESQSRPAAEGGSAALAGVVEPDRWRQGARDIAGRAYRGENSGLLLLVMIVTVVIFGVLLRDTTFLGSSNLLSIIETTTAVTVMAVPTVFVICCGEIDLSFYVVVPCAAYVTALMLQHHNIVIAIVAGIAFGAGVGLVNGAVTVWFKIPSFVVTLGMLGVLQGYSEAITNSSTVTVTNSAFLKIFGQGHVGPIPVLVIWSVGAVIVGGIVLTGTATGRHVLATGANQAAARFSGIKTGRVKLLVLMFSGIGGALGGLIYLGQYTAATYTLGSSDLLNVLAAVIVGGTALAGGQGSVVGALIGSWLIGLIGNALIILGLANPEQLMVRGLIIILAVILSSRPRGRRSMFADRFTTLRHLVRPSAADAGVSGDDGEAAEEPPSVAAAANGAAANGVAADAERPDG